MNDTGNNSMKLMKVEVCEFNGDRWTPYTIVEEEDIPNTFSLNELCLICAGVVMREDGGVKIVQPPLEKVTVTESFEGNTYLLEVNTDGTWNVTINPMMEEHRYQPSSEGVFLNEF